MAEQTAPTARDAPAARVAPAAGDRLAARDAFAARARDVTIEPLAGRALVALALPTEAHARDRLGARLAGTLGTALPETGRSTRAEDGTRLLGLQPDKLLVLFDEREARDRRGALDPEGVLRARLDGMTDIALTDQSDAWAMLAASGADVRDALALLCPLDLHPDAFAIGAVARTLFEHLPAIVLRVGEDAFLLLSPRSSARDFLHEIERAARHARR